MVHLCCHVSVLHIDATFKTLRLYVFDPIFSSVTVFMDAFCNQGGRHATVPIAVWPLQEGLRPVLACRSDLAHIYI